MTNKSNQAEANDSSREITADELDQVLGGMFVPPSAYYAAAVRALMSERCPCASGAKD
jgi:hypothetical protein